MMTEKMIDFVRKTLGISESVAMTGQTKYGDIEEWDSFGHITLLSAVEKEYGIRFDFDEMSSIESIDDLCKVLTSKMN